ncbi:hypothetical protein KP79_PYT03435 [Mizuhopecten yessoensis]|uniref:Uncharacterized protein n=1 Tax=Mizuhopecten yessoensis TaxID=6573 RepID=A0A210PDC0_MIZYE|nr:hypothetical protein KP79_PYT03435 [Mizuhopecten yessoensis]
MEQHAIILKIGPYQKLSFFKRAYVNNSIVHSKNYRCVVKRNNTVVRYGSDDFGHIVQFVKLYKQCQNAHVCNTQNAHVCNTNCACKTPIYLAVIDTVSKLPLQLSTDRVSKAHVSNVVPVSHPSGILQAIHVEDINAVCVWMPVSNELCFVAVNVNKIEKE